MRKTTLVFVFNTEKQILLAMKKRGFWVGKWNGAGGKLEAWETVEQAAVRELFEETNIQVTSESLIPKGVLHFYFDKKPDWNQDVYVFFRLDYTGDFMETEEMQPAWFDTNNLPLQEMWEDDSYWLPRAIDGESIEYDFFFDKDGKLREHKKIV